ncbi:hypothetical protein LEMLEM_LOCUS23578, partial [Lemmus lemmus]
MAVLHPQAWLQVRKQHGIPMQIPGICPDSNTT